jgi:hypothetical protein
MNILQIKGNDFLITDANVSNFLIFTTLSPIL